MVRHSRKTARAKKDRVVMPNRCEPALRHHAAVLVAILTAPRKFIPLERDIEFPCSRFKNTHALRYDLFADSVAGDHGYTIRLHNRPFCIRFLPVGISASGSKEDPPLWEIQYGRRGGKGDIPNFLPLVVTSCYSTAMMIGSLFTSASDDHWITPARFASSRMPGVPITRDPQWPSIRRANESSRTQTGPEIPVLRRAISFSCTHVSD
jgi:hypothetical protein